MNFSPSPLTENFDGSDSVIIELPPDRTIYEIGYISVYTKELAIDLGHIRVGNLTDLVPPFVPPQQMVKKVSML